MTFVQSGKVIAGADGVTHTGVTCFRCGHKGHYADKCPDAPTATLLQTEAAAAVTLLQASHTEAIIGAENANSVSDFFFHSVAFASRAHPIFMGTPQQSVDCLGFQKPEFPH